MGQAVGLLLQFGVAMGPWLQARAIRQQGHSLHGIGCLRPAPATDLGDVELRRHRPAEPTMQGLVHVPVLTARHVLSPYDGVLGLSKCTKPVVPPAANSPPSATSSTTCCDGARPNLPCPRWCSCTAGWTWPPPTSSWSMPSARPFSGAVPS